MPQTKPPNIVVFFTDQHRWDSSSLHGNPLELMPNFDHMAQEGTHVYNSFTSQPLCGPARASLQTGKFATATTVWKNSIPLPPDQITLAHHFKQAGYQTAYIGKWHLAGNMAGPVPPELRGGYEHWLASNILEFTSDAYHTTMYDNDNKPISLPGYRADAVADAAIRYLNHNHSKPFFLFISFVEPHFQNSTDDYPAPQGYRQRYQGRWMPPDLMALGGSSHRHLGGYYGIIKRLDETLGRVRDALKSLNLDKQTVILFTADHGCHFKTRNAEYKRSCHESSIRVPTALCGPGFDGGGRITQLVSIVDLHATLLEAAGIPTPKDIHGRSILPLLHGQKNDWPDNVFIQISEAQLARALRTDQWKYSVTAPDAQGDKDPAATLYREEFLYDLQSDPYELNNLVNSPKHESIRKSLAEKLLHRMTQADEPPAHIQPASVQHPS